MRTVRRTRRVASWLCALAVLFAAIAPSVSHALAAADAAVPWGSADVCGSGDRSLRASSAPGQPETPALPGKHCDYCSVQGSPPGLPASSGAVWTPPAQAPDPFGESGARPPASREGRTPPSRGPPRIS